MTQRTQATCRCGRPIKSIKLNHMLAVRAKRSHVWLHDDGRSKCEDGIDAQPQPYKSIGRKKGSVNAGWNNGRRG